MGTLDIVSITSDIAAAGTFDLSYKAHEVSISKISIAVVKSAAGKPDHPGS